MINTLIPPRPGNRVSISRVRSAIEQTIHLPKKLRLINSAIEQADREIGQNDAAVDKLHKHQDGLAGHPGHEPGAEIESRGNRTLGLTFAATGFATQYVVNRAAFPDWTTFFVILSAVAWEVGLGAIGYGTLRSINNRARPEATLWFGRMLSLVMTGSVLLTAAIAAYLRFATAGTNPAFFNAAAACIWWLAEALPFTAGLWIALAELRSYPTIVANEIRSCEERRVALNQLRAWLISERAIILPRTAIHLDDDGDDDPGAAGMVSVKVASIALLALLGAGSAAAQVCGVAGERAMLGSSDSRQQAIALVVTNLNDYANRFSCKSVVVSTYTDAGAFTPRTPLNVPFRGVRQNCDTAEPAQVARARGVLQHFGGYEEYRRREARDSCRREEASRDSLFNLKWKRFQLDMQSVLATPPLSAPSQVDIGGVLQGLFDSGISDVLLITSGLDTSGGIPDQFPDGARVLLVVYPLAERFGGKAVTDATVELWRKAGASVLPFTALTTPGIFDRLTFPPTGKRSAR